MESNGHILLPPGMFSHKLSKTLSLETPFEYTGTLTAEQSGVIADIGDRRTGLIEMKTGKGKTHCVMGIVNKFQEPTLIAVHNIGTLVDMQERFSEFTNTTPGVWYGKKKNLQPITITTHDSFVNNIELFKSKFGIIIIDEVDVDLTEKMLKAIILLDSEGLFGLTGTPKTKELSTQDMELIFGQHIKMLDQEMNGYNMIPDIIKIEYMSDRFFSFKDWHDLREQLINDESRTRHQINYILKQRDAQTFKYGLLLVERKEAECERYFEIISKLGIPCVMINGDTKVEDDQKNIEFIKQGGGIIVGTVGKMGRGKDVPIIDGVFLFFPNKFDSSTIQAAGRGLRKYPGKTGVILFDWCDLPILKGQASAREATYKREYTSDVKITKATFLDYSNTDEYL